jgi:3-(3-hydroxy-phenyl)propionate hydroxylase
VSQDESDFDVAVVGAGPTGLTLSNLLGRMGVRVLLVERNERTVDEPRAVSIDDESMRTMQAAGIGGEVEAITARGYGSIYRGPDGSPFAMVMPDTREYGFDKRNAFQQPELEALLRAALGRFPNVDVRFGTEFKGFDQRPDRVRIRLRRADGTEKEFSTAYLVGCDGARSFVRKTLGIRLEGGTFEEPWLIVDLAKTANKCRHTEVFCNAERSCITLPGPGGIRRYEFLLHKNEDRETAEQETFARSLLRRFGPDEHSPLRRVRVYTFHARLADRWREGRVFLAGDAAHLTPPFAGQGMNSGLRDAHNLAWKLDEAVRGPISEAFLDSYELERKPHARAMIDLALRLGDVMMPRTRLQGWMVRAVFHMLDIFPPARDYVAHMKYKPKPQFRDGLVWPDQSRPGAAASGRLLPQSLVEAPDRSRKLLDEVLPDQPVLLVFDNHPEKAVSSDFAARAAAVNAKVVGLTPEAFNPETGPFPIFRDVSRFFSAEPYASCIGHILLLRRDRYVAAVRPVAAAAELLDFARQIAPSTLGDALRGESAGLAAVAAK